MRWVMMQVAQLDRCPNSLRSLAIIFCRLEICAVGSGMYANKIWLSRHVFLHTRLQEYKFCTLRPGCVKFCAVASGLLKTNSTDQTSDAQNLQSDVRKHALCNFHFLVCLTPSEAVSCHDIAHHGLFCGPP